LSCSFPFEAALNPSTVGHACCRARCREQWRPARRCRPSITRVTTAFGVYFEAGRLADIAGFLARFDATRDGVWVVVDCGSIVGTIVIDGGSTGDTACAQLRWFIVADTVRGKGMGRRMMQAAMDFAFARYERVVLARFPGWTLARHLYEDFGFRRTLERPSTQWGPEVLEQHWEWAR